MAASKLRFGVVCAGDQVEAASAAAIRALVASEGVELELVIAGARPPARETGGACGGCTRGGSGAPSPARST